MKKLHRFSLILISSSIFPWISYSSLPAAELQVFAAASLSDALREMAPAYEKTSGDTLVFNFAASSVLARQIQEGAPADLFFSADEAKMNALEEKGLLQKNSRKSLLSNSLVIVGPDNSPLKIVSARDLSGPGIKNIALGQPDSVPAGIYAREYLVKIGVWPEVEKKLIPTENVRAALAAVEAGNADAAIVYKTDALISKKVKVLFEIPPAEGPSISYPAAIFKDAPHPGAAEKFLAFLQSAETKKIFEKYGFLVRAPN